MDIATFKKAAALLDAATVPLAPKGTFQMPGLEPGFISMSAVFARTDSAAETEVKS